MMSPKSLFEIFRKALIKFILAMWFCAGRVETHCQHLQSRSKMDTRETRESKRRKYHLKCMQGRTGQVELLAQIIHLEKASRLA